MNVQQAVKVSSLRSVGVIVSVPYERRLARDILTVSRRAAGCQQTRWVARVRARACVRVVQHQVRFLPGLNDVAHAG